MAPTYRIAEVAKRSGFTPAALRYYEDIGLLQPVGRTAAGYRLYDDASLQRLRFIARAKQLGCSLDEVAELSEAWDGARCTPVQERLRSAVAAKVAESQRRIAELTALTADLQRAAAALTAPAAGACDDTCGCLAGPASADSPPTPATAAVPGPLRSDPAAEPEPATDPPVACTLDAGPMGTRVQEWQAVLEHVVSRRAIDGGVRLELAAGADVAEVARLAAAEHDCCRFFRFDLAIDARGAALEVRAPEAARAAVTALFGAAA